MNSLQKTHPSPRTAHTALASPAARHATPSPISPSRLRGLTLMELAVTLAIVAVLAAMAAPHFSPLIERQRLVGAAVQLASDVQLVRSESVLRNEALRLSFYTSARGSCYVVHSGARSACTCGDPASDAAADAVVQATCVGDATPLKTVAIAAATGLSVQANVPSIRFDPLHGTGTPTGTLRLVSARAGSIHHVVNLLGRVRSCSPGDTGAAVPGYRAC